MGSEAQDVLDKIFSALSGGAMGSSGGGLAGALTSGLTGGNSGTATGTQASGGSTVAEIGMDILKSGLGLVPLVGGLLGVFGGGSEAPAPLVKYALPPRVEFEGAESGDGIVEAGYDQMGMARAYTAPGNSGSGGTARPYGPASGDGGWTGTPSVNVTVQAMDARSFLDRSNDIAAAVRDAMLNLNSINDVVNDL
jgi:hypothetical protein